MVAGSEESFINTFRTSSNKGAKRICLSNIGSVRSCSSKSDNESDSEINFIVRNNEAGSMINQCKNCLELVKNQKEVKWN